MRKKIVAGNWKMNLAYNEAYKLLSELKQKTATLNFAEKEMIVCTPAAYLSSSVLLLDQSNIQVGGQNIHQAEKGAFTGETSSAMMKSLGVSHVIVGHSERRTYFGDDDAIVKEKVDRALADGLKVIYCCGEQLDIREQGTHLAFVVNQIKESLFHLSEDAWINVTVAYEPIWAIGTGKTASPEQAEEMHASIRAAIAEQYSADMADTVSILYGGSCKPGNAKDLFAQANVDGGLIGGASLKSEDFCQIFNAL